MTWGRRALDREIRPGGKGWPLFCGLKNRKSASHPADQNPWAKARRKILIGGEDSFLVLEVQFHAPDIALVPDPGFGRLENQGKFGTPAASSTAAREVSTMR